MHSRVGSALCRLRTATRAAHGRWRALTTSAAAAHPRDSIWALRQREREAQARLASFGQYSRLVPRTLVASRPAPQAPSLDLVPAHIPRPPYAATGTPPDWTLEIPILAPEDVAKMRAAARVARDALALGGRLAQPGTTTVAIDAEVHRFIVAQGAYPSCLNYMGFPKSICTSVNNVIAHGIPDARPLADGDIINLDVTVFKDGFHGDTSAMFCVGRVDRAGLELVDATRRALELAVQACGPGVRFAEIGRTIAAYVEPRGYSLSQDLTGHGLGRNFHQNPLIYHHENDEPGVMEPGMAFTIEPIVCQGSPAGVQWPDGWTVATEDGGRSAQFEHTLVVTPTGVDVLTA
ncbi:hypothetical protein H4R21_000778 [Coemansia helicoidea]|uniref:Uncharacterized protein n=1 Tax=Coemansia helicoidea TaxID=1286919 RepID=A0ACC1LE74_9FUNG|nr:hypothetical protein H4R21_000778 [Coemansia helicoidea]